MTDRDSAALNRLLRAGALDAELAALLSLLLDVRTPVVVVGQDADACDAVLDGLAVLLPADAQLVEVAPDDDFDWLPEAVELGWRRERPVRPVTAGSDRGGRIGSGAGVLVARLLGDPGGIAGERARVVVRTLALGYGLLATLRGDGLDDALNTLHAPGIGTDQDERSRLGVVLAVSPSEEEGPRVIAAHYVRPVALDTSGHVQRLPPAVLATWNPGAGRWDHFAWGVLADLAGRVAMAPVAFEREQARRATALASALGDADGR